MQYIGCSGWSYSHWKTVFYKNIPQKKWFSHYMSVFDTVELNNTFYRFPKKENVDVWYQQATENFKYSVKANRIITHYKKFKETKKLIKDFYNVCHHFKEKLGCVLFQLPPNFQYDAEKLSLLVESLDSNFKNVVEFRHPSWWNNDVYKTFEKHGIIFCTVSAPDLPQDFIVTTDDIYLRFHGLSWYDYHYSKKELKHYAKLIKQAGAKNFWCYFNNDYAAYAVENAIEFKGALKKFFEIEG